MNKDKRFLSFYENYNGEFAEHLDSVKTYLERNNDKYKKLLKEIDNILETNTNLQNIFYGEKIDNPLTIEESKLLSKVISLRIESQYIVEEEMFFKGGTEAYSYFKRIGIIA